MRTTLLAAAAAAALFLGGDAARAATRTWQAVRGPLLPVDGADDAHGRFRMLVQERGDAHREFLYVDAWGLDATRDGDGNLPSYRVFLVSADGTATADFGQAFLSPRGRVKLRFHSAREPFPAGVETLAAFGGGTVEIRLGDAAILSGDVPDFIGIGDPNERGSGAMARAEGLARLHPTEDGGRARGFVRALAVNRPAVEVEALRVECRRLLARPGDEFGVVCVDRDGTETRLGTMTVRTRRRIAVLHLSTRRGDAMPGGGVLSLGGQTVEVRDARGTVHLTGTFPDLDPE